MSNDQVEFNPRGMLSGLIAGVAIALGVPAIVLKLGHDLSPTMQLVIVIIGVSIGGLTALTTAFFGLVIPTSISSGGKAPPKPAESASDKGESAVG